jgi:PAS domain S-box-containing protein
MMVARRAVHGRVQSDWGAVSTEGRDTENTESLSRLSEALAEGLAEVDRVIHSSLEYDEITARALAEGARAIGAETGAIIGVEGDGWLTLQSHNFEPSVVGVRLTNAENPHGVMAISTVQTIAVDDAYTDPRVDNDFMKGYGLRSVIVAPLIVRGQAVAGLYYNYNSAIHRFAPEEIAFVTRLASSLSVALENAQLFEAERAQLIRSEILREIAVAASESLSLEEISRRAIQSLGRLPDFVAAAVHVLDSSGPTPVLKNLAALGYPDEALDPIRELPVSDVSNAGRVALHDLDVLTHEDDAERASTEARLARVGLPDVRWIALPVRAGNSLVGTLGVILRGRRPFGEGETSLFQGAAATLGPPIANAQLFRALSETSERLATIMDSIGDAFVAVDSGWRYTVVNRRAEAMLGRSAADLLGKRMDEEFPDVAGWPQYRKAMIQRVPVNFESYAEMANAWVEVHAYPTLDGISMIVSDITPRRLSEEALRQARERADMLATLLDDSSQPFMVGSPDGRFMLFNRAFEKLTGYSGEELAGLKWPDDLTTPETLPIEKAAMAEIERTGLPQRFEKSFLRKDGTTVPAEVLRHGRRGADGRIGYFYAFVTDITERKAAQAREAEARRLDEALNAIGTAVTTTLDSGEILRRLVRLSAEAVGAETAGITLSERGEWAMRESWGMPNDTSLSALNDPVLGSALLDASEQEPIVVNDMGSDPRVDATTMRRLGIRSLMAVPVMTQRAVVGALIFHHRTARGPFTPEQVEFARSLMSIANLALENARLYERERRIADTLQQAVLTEPEEIDGIESAVVYRAASDTANIGGDFFDVFALDGGLVAVVIGDVSGKGLDAARLTSLMHDGIRAYAYEDHDPSNVLGRLNRLVHRLSPPEVFATVFFGVLDPPTGRLVYCAAGHPHPVVVGPDGARFLDGVHSPLVGGFREVDFATGETTLVPDETLVLYTDGITEARRDREMFGERRLLSTLSKLRHTPASRLPDRLLSAVLKFAGGSLRDDTVVVGVKRTGGR